MSPSVFPMEESWMTDGNWTGAGGGIRVALKSMGELSEGALRSTACMFMSEPMYILGQFLPPETFSLKRPLPASSKFQMVLPD